MLLDTLVIFERRYRTRTEPTEAGCVQRLEEIIFKKVVEQLCTLSAQHTMPQRLCAELYSTFCLPNHHSYLHPEEQRRLHLDPYWLFFLNDDAHAKAVQKLDGGKMRSLALFVPMPSTAAAGPMTSFGRPISLDGGGKMSHVPRRTMRGDNCTECNANV